MRRVLPPSGYAKWLRTFLPVVFRRAARSALARARHRHRPQRPEARPHRRTQPEPRLDAAGHRGGPAAEGPQDPGARGRGAGTRGGRACPRSPASITRAATGSARSRCTSRAARACRPPAEHRSTRYFSGMDRSERFYKIQGMLQNRGVVRTQEFLDELEVSKATFKRDLEYLRDRMRAPIVYDRHEEAYRFDMGVADKELWQLPGLLVHGRGDAGAAHDGQAARRPAARRAERGRRAAAQTAARPCSSPRQHSADDIAKRIRILAIGSRKVEPAHFRALSTALLSRRRLRIRHQRRQDGEVLEREVSPQRLVHYRDNWYLDAWCHKRQAVRTFGVDAIEAVAVSDKAAEGRRRRRRSTAISRAVMAFSPAARRRKQSCCSARRGRAGCRAKSGIQSRTGRCSSMAAIFSAFPTRRSPSW